MNWNWPGRQGSNVLTDNATLAETRLKAIKRVSSKTFLIQPGVDFTNMLTLSFNAIFQKA
jgi:hypothetical protein